MTVLMGVVGSTAYGLATEDCEPAVLGVYLADAEDVCGLRGPAALTRTYVSPDGSLTMHELCRFATLALEADPAASELLWLDSYTVRTEEGRALIDIREAFLAAPRVREAYANAALRSFRRVSSSPHEDRDEFSGDDALAERTVRHARSCVRLLRQGRALLTTGRLVIDMSEQREDVFAAGRLATLNPKAFSTFVNKELAALGSIESGLPDSPDTERVNAVLVELRMASLRQAAEKT
ncbi:DNA polymerase beta superfamily protein [Nonomuraea sp. ZG12]|uniref:DNA polymerase beta superfamily protein n=1 Tax=Nonomuraea sp. ZG12 TaxID=3452207 RepID=UPI003F8BB5BA